MKNEFSLSDRHPRMTVLQVMEHVIGNIKYIMYLSSHPSIPPEKKVDFANTIQALHEEVEVLQKHDPNLPYLCALGVYSLAEYHDTFGLAA